MISDKDGWVTWVHDTLRIVT